MDGTVEAVKDYRQDDDQCKNKTQRINKAIPDVLRCISAPLVTFVLGINPSLVYLVPVYSAPAA
jgi:hypothetical protein